MNNFMPKAKYSPCIGICTLNEQGICIGCKRTIEEIIHMGNHGELWDIAENIKKGKK